VRSDAIEQPSAADPRKLALPAQPVVVAASAGGSPASGQLSKLVSDMQKKVASYSPELQFSIDQHSGADIVKMTDKSTNTVIWQFPSEVALQVAKELDQYRQGLVVNHKA
jgi:flagellar protein FlaG